MSPKTPRRGVYLLPNLFTISALFAGFYAVVAAMKGHFDSAAIAIFIAMLMDTLDGRVARLTNTQTSFGAQLDSLSDMVSFGIAPALVMYTWSLHTLGKPGWLAAFIYAVTVALRLARFNIQTSTVGKRYFRGFPSTAAAGVIASLIWVSQSQLQPSYVLSVVEAFFIVIVALLMISTFRYYSFKDLDLKNKVSFRFILLSVLFLVFIAFDPPRVLFLLFLCYLLSGPVALIWRWYKHVRKNKNDRRR